MAKLTGGQVLVNCLESNGVKIVFGMPGVNVLHIYDALRDSSIRHILVRHEQSAAFMADAYARVTGKPGVCLTTAGPGLTNAITGMATAYADSIPVLVLAGEISSSLIGKRKGVLHETDQTSLLRPVTKRSVCVLNAADIPKIVSQGFQDLTNGRPRPVYVGLPDDIVESTVNLQRPGQTGRGKKAQVEHVESIEAAVRLLSRSRSPIILAGGGVVSANASLELVEIAESLTAPVVTTVMGAGSIAGDHPLFLARSRTPKVVDEIFKKADVMLAVGTRFSSLSMSHWALKVPKNLIHIDVDPEVIGRNYRPRIGIRGDAKSVLQQISNRLRSKPQADRSHWKKTAEALKASEWKKLESSHPTEVKIVMDIRAALKRDAIVAADTTILSYWMQRIFPIYEPRTFLYSFGYAAMGYGLPAAMASKIAFPERQVLAVCGDGGFTLSCQDLATAVENHVNIPIVLHNNGGFGILRHIQKTRFRQRYIAVDLRNPDFVKFAESFGAQGIRVEAPEEIAPILRETLRADQPTIIDFSVSLNPPP